MSASLSSRVGRTATGIALTLAGFGLVTSLLAVEPSAAPATTSQPTAASQAATRGRPRLDEEAILNFLKQYEPELHKDALMLRDKDPKRFAELLKEFASDVRNLMDLQRRNVPLFEVTLEDRRLAYRALQVSKELRDCVLKPETREAKTKELNRIVRDQFNVRQQKRQMELAELQQKLDSLKHELEDRESNKDDLIAQRVNDLLKQSPKVEW